MNQFYKMRSVSGYKLPALFVVLLFLCGPVFAQYNVTNTTDGHNANQLRGAIEAADAAGGTSTINVGPGTYTLTLGEITFGNNAQNITITGTSGAASTIISMTTGSGKDRIFLINPPGTNPNIHTTLQGLTFQNGYLTSDIYGGGAIICGGPNNTVTLTSCVFTNNSTGTGGGSGGAMQMNGGGMLTISQCTFTNNVCPTGDGGALYYFLPNAINSNIISGSLSITNSTFTNNTVVTGTTPPNNVGSGGAISIGIQGTLGGTSSVSIQKNTFTNNHVTTASGNGGAIDIDNGFSSSNTALINYNRFVGNTATNSTSTSALAMNYASGNVDATNNWWDCNGGPTGCSDKAAIVGTGSGGGTLTLNPYLQLTSSASPSTICSGAPNNTSTITASFLKNSAGTAVAASNLTAFTGVPVSFSATLGTISNAQTTIQSSGTATATFTSNGTAGTATVNPQVDNVPSNDATARSSITVNASPAVTNNPTSQNVCAGSLVTFTAAFSGTPAPTTQWQVSTDDGATFTNITGATGASLVFTATSADNGNQYRSVGTNNCGTVTTTAATLTVTTSPAVTTNPSDVTVCAPNNASFTASFTGAPNIQWQVSTDGGATFTNITGATSSTLSFATASSQNGNKYRAVGTNSCGTITTTAATLTVNAGPAVTTNPASQTVCAGSPVTFTTAFSGSPTPTIQWQVSTDGGATFTDIAVATSTTLTFTTSASDGGKQYRSVATNTCGSATSTAAALTVNTAPAVTTNPSDVTVPVGNTATFTTAFSGTPAPSIQWQVSMDGGATFISITGATSTTLSFTAQVSQNGNQYRSVGTNSCGSATTTAATLTVTSGPTSSVLSVSGPSTICNGSTANLVVTTTGGTSPYTVVYSDGTNNFTVNNYTSGTAIPVSPTATTSYSLVSVTDANSYTGTGNSGMPVVTVNLVPTVNPVDNQTVCNNGSTTDVNFTGAVQGTVYNWTNDNSSINLASSGSGNIPSFTATNATSAPVTATIMVTPSYTNAGTTCTGTPVTFTITVNPTPDAVATPSSQTTCSGTTITTIALTGNVSGTTYNWTRDNTGTVTGIAGNGSGDISGTLTNTTNAPVTVTFTITPTANGCPGTAITATVTVNPTVTVAVPSNIAVNNTTGLCGAVVNYTTTATGEPAPAFSYSFTGATTGNGSGNGNGSTFNVGVTTVTVTATNTCGMVSNSFMVTVTDNENPTITPPANVTTSVNNANCSATGVNLGTPVTNDNCAVQNVSNDAPSVFPSGTTTVTWTVTDVHGNSATATQTVTVSTTLNASVTAGDISCSGGSTTITVNASGGTGPYTYQLNGGSFQTSNKFIVRAGSYTVLVKDAEGCTVSNPVTINQPSPINMSVSANPVLCHGGTTTVSVSASGGTPDYTGTGTFTKAAGTYTFTVTDSKGCTASKRITITQPAALSVSLYSKTNVSCYGSNSGSIMVKATGGTQPYSYKINTASSYQSSPTFNNLAKGTYSVLVTDHNGCKALITGISVTQPSSALVLTLVQKKDVSCHNGTNGYIKVSASGGGSSYRYSLNGCSYGTSGTFSHLHAGTYTVTAKDANGCTKSLSVIIKNGTCDCDHDDDDDKYTFDLKSNDGIWLKAEVLPNPTETQFTLVLTGNSDKRVEIRVLDMNGKAIYYETGSANQSYIFGQNFAGGMYIVQILQGGNMKTIKVIKTN